MKQDISQCPTDKFKLVLCTWIRFEEKNHCSRHLTIVIYQKTYPHIVLWIYIGKTVKSLNLEMATHTHSDIRNGHLCKKKNYFLKIWFNIFSMFYEKSEFRHSVWHRHITGERIYFHPSSLLSIYTGGYFDNPIRNWIRANDTRFLSSLEVAALLRL